MSTLENYRDANGEAIQPYYAAYLILKGFATPDEARWATCPNGTNVDYLTWNREQWGEFCDENHIPRDLGHFHREGFAEWLEARCTNALRDRAAAAIDAAARVAVEVAA